MVFIDSCICLRVLTTFILIWRSICSLKFISQDELWDDSGHSPVVHLHLLVDQVPWVVLQRSSPSDSVDTTCIKLPEEKKLVLPLLSIEPFLPTSIVIFLTLSERTRVTEGLAANSSACDIQKVTLGSPLLLCHLAAAPEKISVFSRTHNWFLALVFYKPVSMSSTFKVFLLNLYWNMIFLSSKRI